MKGGFKDEVQHGLTRRETPRGASWIRQNIFTLSTSFSVDKKWCLSFYFICIARKKVEMNAAKDNQYLPSVRKVAADMNTGLSDCELINRVKLLSRRRKTADTH